MRFAITGLLEITEQAFAFHEAMNEIPVVLVLHAERARGQRIFQHEPESPPGLRMHAEYICQYRIGGLVLPDSSILAKPQEVHPRRKAELVACQASIGTKTAGSVHITVMGEIGAVSLLDPERDGLGNQRLEFNGVGCRYRIHHEFVMATNPRSTNNPLRQQNVTAQRTIQFQQTVSLDESTRYCPDYVLCTHAGPYFSYHAIAHSRDFTKLQTNRPAI